uniref:Beta V1 protein n=1 Tax=Cotton leaf curl Multan betasatellite TaxID=306025 RepID=Q8QNS8_9VIRU|nr:beta V1 protein [Cotton leaf curl Multan betasatellite]
MFGPLEEGLLWNRALYIVGDMCVKYALLVCVWNLNGELFIE